MLKWAKFRQGQTVGGKDRSWRMGVRASLCLQLGRRNGAMSGLWELLSPEKCLVGSMGRGKPRKGKDFV